MIGVLFLCCCCWQRGSWPRQLLSRAQGHVAEKTVPVLTRAAHLAAIQEGGEGISFGYPGAISEESRGAASANSKPPPGIQGLMRAGR